jgi:hypothetical protein
MNVGSLRRTTADDYPVAVDFSAPDIFVSNDVTTATVTGSPTSADGGVTIGSASVASDVVSVRISGGTSGVPTLLTFTATNSASPANVLRRYVLVYTHDCG